MFGWLSHPSNKKQLIENMKDTLTPTPASIEDVVSILNNGLGDNLDKQDQENFVSAFKKFKGHESMTKQEVADVCRLTSKLTYTYNHLQEHGAGPRETGFTLESIQNYLDEILNA